MSEFLVSDFVDYVGNLHFALLRVHHVLVIHICHTNFEVNILIRALDLLTV